MDARLGRGVEEVEKGRRAREKKEEAKKEEQAEDGRQIVKVCVRLVSNEWKEGKNNEERAVELEAKEEGVCVRLPYVVCGAAPVQVLLKVLQS